MKQTNNAIKFLMAQYRAIFKHAYLKGIVSAVVLTTGLAAGSANAATYASVDDINAVEGDTVTINDTDALTIAADKDGNITKNIVINAGSATHSIKLGEASGPVALTSENSFTVKNGAKMNFGEASATKPYKLSVHFKEYTFESGSTVNIYANKFSGGTKSTDIDGDLITVNGTVNITSNDGSTAFLKGDVIDINSGALIKLDSSIETTTGKEKNTISKAVLGFYSSDANSSGSKISIDNATVLMLNNTNQPNDNEGRNRSSAQIFGSELTVNDSNFAVSGAGAGEGLKGTAQIETHATTFNNSTFYVENGAHIAFNPQKYNAGSYQQINGTVEFNGGVLALGGDLILNRGGTLTISDTTKLFATQATAKNASDPYGSPNGSIVVGIESSKADKDTENFDGSTNPTLKISSTKLKEFFTDDTNASYDLVNASSTHDNAKTTVKDYAGKVILTDGARLKFTDTGVVNISDFSFGLYDTQKNKPLDNTSANFYANQKSTKNELGSGKDKIDPTIRMEATNMAIEKSLLADPSANGDKVNSSEQIVFAAENLTLGGGEGFNSATGDLGIKSAEARNVVFKDDYGTNRAFTLKDTLTLSSTRSITSGGSSVVVGEDGSIVGELNIGKDGDLIVDGGKYHATDNITINGGKLTVKNTDKADESSLKIDNLAIDLSSGAANIEVKGGLNGEYNANDPSKQLNKLTQLDLSNGFTVTGNAASGTLTATSGAVVLLDADDVQKQIDKVEENKTSVNGALKFNVDSGAMLDIDGDLTLDFTAKNAANLNKVVAIGSGGIVEADSVTVNSTIESGASALDAKYGLGSAGTLRVNSLTLNNNSVLSNSKEADVAYLNGGTFEVAEKLSSKDTVTLQNINSQTNSITLKLKTADTSGSGTIDAKGIKIDSDSGEVSIAQGNWSAGATNFEIAQGNLNIGDVSDPDAEMTASLTAADLKATGGNIAINKGSSATFDTFTQTGTAITVNGQLTINGKESGEGTSKVWGADTSDATGTIKVAGNNAVLKFGSTALGGISLSGDAIKYANDNDTFDANITLSGFATLELDFADSKMNFTEEGLKNLRKEFISGSDGSALSNGYIDIGAATIEGVTVNADGTISWNNLEKISDIIADIKQDDLENATLVDIDSSDVVNANVGNIKADGSTSTVTVGQTTLNKANDKGYFITNASGDLVSASVKADGTLGLYNGGQIKDVTLEGGASDTTTLNVVSSGEAVTTINSINGGTNTLVNIDGTTVVNNNVDVDSLNVNQSLTVAKDIKLSGDLTSSEGVATGKLSARELKVDGETAYSGDLELAGNATFGDIAYLGGNNTFNGNKVTFNKGAELDRGITTAKTIYLGDGSNAGKLEITGNAQVTADVIQANGSNGIYLTVGEEAGTEGDESWESSAGYLTVGRLDLNGGVLSTDPEYGKSATIVAINSFGDTNSYDNVKGNEAGNLNGQIIALRNSIVGIGVADTKDAKAIAQLQSTFSQYIDANGSLDGDKVGSIVYVAKALDVENATSKIIVDSSKSFSGYESAITEGGTYATNISDNNIYLGNNSVLAVSDHAALDSKAGDAPRPAIEFTYKGEASLYAEKNAKIVLVGDGFSSRDKVYLFDDNNNDGILIKGNSVDVETINGLLHFTLAVGEETTGGNLSLNREAVGSAFSMASAPVKYSLISYAANDNNWDDNSTDHKVDALHGDVASGVYTKDGVNFYTKNGDTETPVKDNSDYVVYESKDAEGKTTYTVYHDAYNYFLDDVVRNSTTGLAAEQAARLAVYGGAAQAALTAGATTYDAISGRLGVGAQTGSITFADNGQGAGLWVYPVYKNHDSDGFGAQGASYGVDMDLYGVALGGDFTMANGLRVGAAFNVGSGDADGQGTGNGVTNDFDYYGFAVYGGFNYDKFSVVGDISYTVVDNDVEANTEVEKISASMDSTNLSVGVTGQYTFNYGGMNIVPHAGLRYTNVDLDDYNVKGSGDIAHFNADSFNVFSIPVGVTFSKEITAGEWTIQPAFDLTLTANMGDDSVEGSVAWAGISNMSTKVESEVIDSFTYGATLGVSAKTGNLSLGFGVNYTGASSADEYGVGANARFVF